MYLNKHDAFFIDLKCQYGLPPELAESPHWKTTDRSLIYTPGQLTLCDLNRGDRHCSEISGSVDWIAEKIGSRIHMSGLNEGCASINKQIDHAYAYRADYILNYLCTREDELEEDGVEEEEEGEQNEGRQHYKYKSHWHGRDVVFSGEIGYMGITAKGVPSILITACTDLQEKYNIQLHHIFSIEIRINKGECLSVGGCPLIMDRYRTRCHPSLCMCQNKRSVVKCHHWFIDTLLGGNMDVKTAHPLAIFPSGIITTFRPLVYAIIRCADDIVWGGVLAKAGLVLRFKRDHQPTRILGETTAYHHGLQISINSSLCIRPKLLAETVLHELCHARVGLDFPQWAGLDSHGGEWLHRMSQVRSLLAYRLTDNYRIRCNRLINGHIRCLNCNLVREIAHARTITMCPECFSNNVQSTPYPKADT